MISKDKIKSIFDVNGVEGFVNIVCNKWVELEYDSFMDETTVEHEDSTSVSVTVIKDNRKSWASFDGFSIEKLEKAVKEASAFLDISEQDQDIVMPNISDCASWDFFSEEISGINLDYLKWEFKKVKEYEFKTWIKLEEYSASYGESEHFYINTNWSYKSQKSNKLNYYVAIVWEIDWNKDSDYEYETFKTKESLTSEKLSELENRLIDKLTPEKSSLQEGEYIVTLDRDVSKNFVSFVLSSLSAEGIREWVWLFAWKNLWDKILSEDVTIINDPNLENGLWNKAFDGEWVTCKKFELIKNWVLTSKLCDYKNSIKEWGKFLWNSGKYNVIFESSKYSDDYLDWSKFLFTNLMAFHSVDSNTWSFSLNGEWYELEDWKKVRYVKNIALTSNVKDIFNDIIAIWNDVKKSSTIKIGSITIKKWYLIP